ncbi:glycosyltransferase family 4 protein [soil metagenome]
MNIKTQRILMIAPTSFFADYGCHVRILEEITGLEKRGHTVELCTYHNGRDVNGLSIHRTVDIPWRKRAIVGSSRHKIYLDMALMVTVLRRIQAFKPEIIHAHLHEGALIGSVAGRLFNIPVVFDYQGSLTEEMIDHGFLPGQGLQLGLVRWIERRIDAMPAVILPSSNAAGGYLDSRGTRTAPVQVVPDSVDLARFDPDASAGSGKIMREKLGIPPKAPVVVYLGLLADYQGTPDLIQAADLFLDRHRDAYVVIAGYPGVGRYARLAAGSSHAARILFPGRIPYDEAPALLAAADVAVAPKRSVSEANGKVLNYMAMRLPTVCTDTPVNRDLLGDLGRYVPAGDHEALSRELDRALDTPDALRRSLRERVAKYYNWDDQIMRIEQIYQRLLRAEGRLSIPRSPVEAGSAPSDN